MARLWANRRREKIRTQRASPFPSFVLITGNSYKSDLSRTSRAGVVSKSSVRPERFTPGQGKATSREDITMKFIASACVILVSASWAMPQQSSKGSRTVAVTRNAAQRAAAPRNASLTLRRVVLYSNGVAFLERRGTVNGNAEIGLD